MLHCQAVAWAACYPVCLGSCPGWVHLASVAPLNMTYSGWTLLTSLGLNTKRCNLSAGLQDAIRREMSTQGDV